MNNEYCQSTNCYRTYCNQINRCSNYDNSANTCCPHHRQDNCCPTTITVGTTTTGAAGTQASVTNSGTATNAILNFVIPRGDTGATGPAGADGQDGTSATVTVGTTTTGEPGTQASVTNSGTATNAILNFVIPRGDTGAAGADGEDGTPATVTIGTTTTGEPGTQASVTNTGTVSNAILNFTIPRGETATITPGVAVPLLEDTADLATVITTVNALITSLTNAGFLA